ncbi:MAG: hypothetical protein KGZ30_01080 [Anaplasmataceae bacterium]|nr:hypothetical protein [Anaplasmataceae bacterium]
MKNLRGIATAVLAFWIVVADKGGQFSQFGPFNDETQCIAFGTWAKDEGQAKGYRCYGSDESIVATEDIAEDLRSASRGESRDARRARREAARDHRRQRRAAGTIGEPLP